MNEKEAQASSCGKAGLSVAVAALAPWAGSRASPLPLGNSPSPPAVGTLPEAMQESASGKAADAEGPSSPPWLFPLEAAFPGPGERGCLAARGLSGRRRLLQSSPRELAMTPRPPSALQTRLESRATRGPCTHPPVADVTRVNPGVRSRALVLSSFPPLWIVQTPRKRTHAIVPRVCTGSQPERYKIHVHGRKGQSPDLV